MEDNQISGKVAPNTATVVVGSPDLPSKVLPAGEPNQKSPEIPPMSQYRRRWLQGKAKSSTSTDLPPGVCNTVYYIDKNGVYRHFTPGLPPKKKVIDGPIWKTSDAERVVAQNQAISDDEDIKIPDALF